MSPRPDIEAEHRALDRHLAEVEFLAQKRAFPAAAKHFTEFSRALLRHLDEEESVIFPELEARKGDPTGALPTVRAQHRDLERTLESLAAAIASSQYGSFCASLDVLDRLLKEHHATEERLLALQADPA